MEDIRGIPLDGRRAVPEVDNVPGGSKAEYLARAKYYDEMFEMAMEQGNAPLLEGRVPREAAVVAAIQEMVEK